MVNSTLSQLRVLEQRSAQQYQEHLVNHWVCYRSVKAENCQLRLVAIGLAAFFMLVLVHFVFPLSPRAVRLPFFNSSSCLQS